MNVVLILFKSNGQRRDIRLQEGVTTIGRGADCDVKLPLDAISRKHCQLEVDAGQVRVRDLGSQNGTYVGTESISERRLRAGDRLSVGPVVFTVQINGVPALPGDRKAGTGSSSQGLRTAGSGAATTDLQDFAQGLRSDDGHTIAPSTPTREEIDPIAALEAINADDQLDPFDR